jgi:hypothetical protein
MIFRIDDGRFGETDLTGVKFAFIIRSGRVMADGGWLFGGVVDEGAGEEQRAALAAIIGGEAGGIPAMIQTGVVSDYKGVEFRAIEFVQDGHNRSVEIPGLMSYAIEGVLSRNGGGGEPYYIDNVGHPANSRLALARAAHMRIDGFGLALDLQGEGNNGHFAPFSWSN